jgi:CBS domain-containing protein
MKKREAMTSDNQPETITDLIRPTVTIKESSTLREALKKMIHERRNSLVVVDSDGRFVGGLSAVDLISQVLPDYLEEDSVTAHFADDSLLRRDAQNASDTEVKDFMSENMTSAPEDASILEAAVLATRHGNGRVTIVDSDERPVGILTRTEIKQVIAKYLDISEEPADSA